MQQTRWFPSPFGVPTAQQSPLFRPSWQATTPGEWPVAAAAAAAAAGTKEWEKWSAGQLLMGQVVAPIAPITVVKGDEKDEKEDSDSYNASASQSPSDAEEHARMEHGEDHIDVEETETNNNNNNESSPVAQAEEPMKIEEPKKEEEKDTPMEETPAPVVEMPSHEEASRLLLNFSQHSFTSPGDEARIAFAPAVETKEFVQSQSSAFSAPEPAHRTSPPAVTEGVSASFSRPPGLGPSTTPCGTNTFVCQLCGFTCNSKFHYNSHMNTHGDHQCTMCDYTSRTEGRLKKHMRESHTVEEQLAAGLEIDPKTPTKPDTSALSTTMASIVDAATAVANGQIEQAVTTLAAAMGADALTSPGLSTIASSALPSALEQIRAFTEKNPLLPEAGGALNIASALGAIGQFNDDNKANASESSNSEPRRNSNGKIKQLKCKQCPHISYSKNDQWAHARTHIPQEKQMNCPKCNFVTEYKHHLEYHIRNHLGSKPFQCKKCTYQCVNKSMLNSHMKSHTNVYQFRCMDCTYATKYCHSLKLHLRKYEHRRVPDGMDMQQGSPPSSRPDPGNPLGAFGLAAQFTQARPPPPATTLAQTLALTAPIVTSQSLNYASQMLLRQHQMEQMMGLVQPQLKCGLCEFQTANQEELMRHNLTHLMNSAGQSPIVSLYNSLPQMQQLLPLQAPTVIPSSDDHESGNAGDDEMDGSSGSTGSPGGSSKACDEDRKKKGFKVDQIGERLLGKSPSGSECGSSQHFKEEEADEQMESSVSPVDTSMVPTISTSMASGFLDSSDLFRKSLMATLGNLMQNKEDWRFQCQHCRMAFQEQALYHIHMGYHGYEHAFKCNRCGHIASDPLGFNLHLLQASHE